MMYSSAFVRCASFCVHYFFFQNIVLEKSVQCSIRKSLDPEVTFLSHFGIVTCLSHVKFFRSDIKVTKKVTFLSHSITAELLVTRGSRFEVRVLLGAYPLNFSGLQ